MIREVTALLVLCSLTGCDQPAAFAFADTSVTLPDDTTALPPGRGADLVTANCTSCHSAEQIMTQPKLDRAAWEVNITKMVKVYKAPIASEDVPAIVDYLVGISNRRELSAGAAATDRHDGGGATLPAKMPEGL